jgi:Metallo-peptidase family M12B Reprolysin-like/Secretion system C-terminal sorting domain
MKKALLFLAIIMSFGTIVAQSNSVWQRADVNKTSTLSRVRPNINDEGELYFTVDLNTLRQTLSVINDRSANNTSVEVEFPNMNGEVEKFRVIENSNFDAELQAQFPQIRAYKGQGITDKSATINFSISPQGVQTMLFRPGNGMEFIEAYDKAKTTYVLFNSRNRNAGKVPFNCSTVEEPLVLDLMDTASANRASNHISKTMRLALSCVAEYSNYFGATSAAQVALVLTAFNNTMTRCNGVNEKDLAVHLNIIAASTNVIYYNATTDPYSAAAAGSGGAWNGELQANLTSVITAANYDIGHLFGASGGGGNAGCIGCVCVASTKGSGFTSPGDAIPQGDNFDIDYVVHEMGHQMGGTHSFSYGGLGGTEVPSTGVEPGSGSSIMGYAGITSYDVATHSDALFCYRNINQIQTNLNPKTCPVSTTMTANSTPVVSAGTDYTIPKGTAYVLTGTATDADPNDVLTYNWEENDLGTSATLGAISRVNSTKAVGPNFRIFKSSPVPYRYFPQMGKIISGILLVTTSNNTNWESLFNGAANRNFNFTFTTRDNHIGTDYGQTSMDPMILTVDVTKGPLTVTSQATTGIQYDGATSVPVTWAVNSTDLLSGATDVDILITTNASTALETLTTPSLNPTIWTTIASGVPNNGTASVTLPNPATAKTACRFMVKASGNVFFAVNSTNFRINPNLATQEFGLDNFTLFPNPNQGSFNIKFDSNSSNTINVTVFDIRGREVYTNSYSNTGMIDQNIKLNTIEAGVYLVKVVDGDRKVVKRIVIE